MPFSSVKRNREPERKATIMESKSEASVKATGGIHRRQFLKTAAGAAGLACLPGHVWAGGAPAILPVKNPNSKLQIGVIGLGGISGGHLLGLARDEHLVALCDCYPERITAKLDYIKDFDVNNVEPADMKQFVDYREMLSQMEGKLDGVVVCTPDHNHAVIGIDCMKRGIHVFIEKPFAHNIHEAYALRDAARQYGVAAAQGNEGHTFEHVRRTIEVLASGMLGPVREAYHWCAMRSTGGAEQGLNNEPMTSVDERYRLWSVPVPEDTAFVRYKYGEGAGTDELSKWYWGWHADRRFGSGSIGDWAVHITDSAYCGLRIGEAPGWKVESVERLFGGDRLHYKMEVYRWTVPARAEMPPLEVYWHAGLRPNPEVEVTNEFGKTVKAEFNMPQKALALQQKHDYKLPTEGGLYIGEKGSMVVNGYSCMMAFFPRELTRELEAVPKVLPRIEVPRRVSSNRGEWYHAIRTGEPATTNFDYASGYAEFYLSALLASRARVGESVEYDRVNRRIPTHPELEKFLSREYRKGYEI